MSSNIRVNSITPSVGNSVAIGTAGGSVVFQCDTINFSGTSGVTNFTEDISVDGHTELDNVNISGVVTATSFAGPLTGNVTGNVTGNLTGNVTGTATTATALSGSPSITVTDITASGNVSIAGTLTYEDVTNVDSIGIITARNDINIENATPTLNLIDTDGSTTASFLGNSGNIFYSTSSSNRDHIFRGSTTEVVRITGDGTLGISSTAPKTDVDISQKTGAVALPQGTTAQRPTGSAPYIRKNTTNNALEYYDGTSWVEIITDYFPTGSVILG